MKAHKLEKSRELGVTANVEDIHRRQREAWLENREAIKAYNDLVAIYTLLEARFESGDEDVAARHDEHQL